MSPVIMGFIPAMHRDLAITGDARHIGASMINAGVWKYGVKFTRTMTGRAQ